MDNSSLISLYRQMLLIRVFEDKSAEMYTKAKIAGFLHLTNGQEAIAVGAMSALNPDDDLFTHYRDHGYAMLKGAQPEHVMAELFGRSGGTTGGRGGSMHLVHMESNYWGGYAIVGGHLTLACGVAVANQFHKNGRVVTCVMGDGSTNIGTFHAALNWAEIWKLPVIFLVENNQYRDGHADWRIHSALPDIYRKADGYGMAAEKVDGNDVLAVHEVHRQGRRQRARAGEGPTLVEAVTYRHRGHSMADADVQRDKATLAEWKKRDPIHRFANEVLLASKASHRRQDLRKLRPKSKLWSKLRWHLLKPARNPRSTRYINISIRSPSATCKLGGSLIRPPHTGQPRQRGLQRQWQTLNVRCKTWQK